MRESCVTRNHVKENIIMRTFKITTKQGDTIELEQLATFTHYIQNEQFRFVVTREAPNFPIVVTHRASGKRVTDITPLQQMVSLGDLVGAARLAIGALIAKAGEARVKSVLAAAEAR
jgi:hypothetical protein